MKHRVLKWSWKCLLLKEGHHFLIRFCEILNILAPEIDVVNFIKIKENSLLISLTITSLVEEYHHKERVSINKKWTCDPTIVYFLKFHSSLIKSSFILLIKEKLGEDYNEDVENEWLQFLDRLFVTASNSMTGVFIKN